MRWQIPKSLFILMLSFAQPSIGEAQDSSYAKDYSAAKKFQQALRKNDRRSVAALVRYTMANVEPLASIKNAHEFIARWNESFDATNTKALLTADA